MHALGTLTRMRLVRRVSLCLCAVLFPVAAVAAPGQTQSCATYSRFERQLDGFEFPTSVAYARDGRLAVVERDARRVRVFAADGTELLSLADSDGNLPFGLVDSRTDGGPRAVAFDAADRLTVIAPGRIATFDATSGEKGRWRVVTGVPVRQPVAIAWRESSNRAELVVADAERGLVILGDDGGERFATKEGIGLANGIAIGGDGSIFVSDARRHAIVRYAADGTFRARFGERGAFPGLLNLPAGLAVRGDCLYVADELNHRVQIFSFEGKSLGLWGMHAVVPREGSGKIHYPCALAIAPDGERMTVAEGFERRLQRFLTDESGTRTPPAMPSLESVLSHFGAAVASDDDLLVLTSPETANAFVFDLRGATPLHVATFGGSGDGPDKLVDVSAIGVDGRTQRIVVLDPGAARLSVFQLERDRSAAPVMDPFMPRLVRAWSLDAWSARVAALVPNSTLQAPVAPAALAADGDDWWIYDAAGGLLVRTDARLEPKAVVATGVTGGSGLAVRRDADGARRFRIAVPDVGDVATVSEDGTATWSPGRSPFRRPTSVATRGGVTVVTDAALDQVFLLTDAGVATVGRRGISDGEFWLPDGVAAMEDGGFVVIDRGNHRAQVIDAKGTWRLTFGLGRAYTRPRERGES
jgi:DNA-binding beta-propeller fold protein YncE